MAELKIPVGISDFTEIRENGYYYVDKTKMIRELLKTEAAKVTLITRPRRFGKTLGMSTLEAFFNIRKKSESLFEGLHICEDPDLCQKWMNQYPVLFVTFKDIDGRDFQTAYGRLKGQIADLFREHSYLLESSEINAEDKETFLKLAGERAEEAQVSRSLKILLRMLNIYYGKQVILLLDEYDVPVAKASSKGYYEPMLDVVKGMLGTALKDNAALKFAVITGCLKITKESIFTGTNNFTTDTISDRRYEEFFGFTDGEVKKLLKDAGHEECLETVKEWYDGYQFGEMDIYCPWDVLNYVNKLLAEGKKTPESFWEHTSDNAVIRQFLERTDFDVTEKFEILLRGESIRERLEENLTYDLLESSEENLWSLLYSTGYLTRVRETGKQDTCTALRIPNAEVMEIFRKSVVEWFYKKAAESDRRELFAMFWKGDSRGLTERLSDLLFDTISYHDYAESFYHAFLTGLFSSAGYIVESNYENGLGRSDVVIKDRKNRRAAVIEAKAAKSAQDLEKECQRALGQIEEKQYARKIERSGFKSVLEYGIAFYQKSCMVLEKTGRGSL